MGPLREITWRGAVRRLLRPTVRLRLTMLYGFIFILSGAALLAITNALMLSHQGSTFSANGSGGGMLIGSPHASSVPHLDLNPSGLTPAQVEEQAKLLRAQALHDRADQQHQLLIQSGIALAIMVVISIVLGWIVAGRVLRRIRTITTAAREISANNLHQRLALNGPEDELKELGDTFDELLERLDSSFQAQRAFVANASHELRTPLARQRAVGQVALADPDATVQSLRAAHERVLAAGAQQERLIAALLTLAKGQRGLAVREPFDLAVLTGHALTATVTEAEQRGIKVRSHVAPAPTAGDPRLAERLATNLVDNALRHNAAGGWIEVLTGSQDGCSFLSVANTGPLVPAEEIERLFQPFQRLQTGRMGRGEGLGLGLSIVQAIATAHSATVDARPRPGGGLAVTVRFPSPCTSP